MGREVGGALRRSRFVVLVATIAGLTAIQSIVHLALVLGSHRIGTIMDLDRSNGVPDIVSTLALAAAAAGAAALALHDRGWRVVTVPLAIGLSVLWAADVLHLGAHPTPTSGKVVIAVVGCVGVLLAVLAHGAPSRTVATLGAAGCILLGSFFVIGLDRFFHRFERERGDPIAEYQIVTKEGLELLGWFLVALALWDEALRRRALAPARVTARASRARAAPRRRAA